MIDKRPRIIDVEREPQKCPICGERVSLGPGPSDRFLSIYNDIMTQNEVNVRHINIPSGQWHSLKSLESGTILFEAKNGKYAPLAEDEVYR